ncbi:MAG: hypothetical protein K0R73_904 [Candidatus Midichloriaceae bacterium]|jgi:hypothetical protein|nr:hypothetical protein [Candidatus Midichloriaceae bacterium]
MKGEAYEVRIGLDKASKEVGKAMREIEIFKQQCRERSWCEDVASGNVEAVQKKTISRFRSRCKFP